VLSVLSSVAYCAVHNVTCPKAADIKPCECYTESAQIYCNGIDFDDNHVKTIGPRVKTDNGLFHLLLIRETKLKTIPKLAFNESKFEKIFIESMNTYKCLNTSSKNFDLFVDR